MAENMFAGHGHRATRLGILFYDLLDVGQELLFAAPALKLAREIYAERYPDSTNFNIELVGELNKLQRRLTRSARATGLLAVSRVRREGHAPVYLRSAFSETTCGYAIGSVDRDGRFELTRLRLHPFFRGHAIGAALAEEAIADAGIDRDAPIWDSGRIRGLEAYDTPESRSQPRVATDPQAPPMSAREARAYLREQFPVLGQMNIDYMRAPYWPSGGDRFPT